jgi:hypothetical protein
MAKKTNQRVVGIKSSTLAVFEGTFMGILGLGVAILYSMRTTVDIAAATDSVLSGLAFGLATGVVSILVLPLIYFGIGWIFGYLHGFVFNVIAESSGGLVFRMEEDNK